MNRNNITIAIILILAISLLAAKCKEETKQTPNTISVTASFYPLCYFAAQIGGDKAIATNITPAGAEPHDYELTPRDIGIINDSKLLILNGGGLEPWAGNIKNNIDINKTKIVVAGEELAGQKMIERGQKINDPHIWLSPPLAKQMVDKITEGFVAVDPSDETYYRANADSLKAKLDTLDDAFRKGLANCATPDFITSHAAFGYLASNYGLRQVPIAGLSPDAEPSPQKLAELAGFAKQNNIRYIFFESLVSPKLARTLATEIGAQTLVLNPIEGLTREELAQGKNYFSEMRANLANLRKALQCKT